MPSPSQADPVRTSAKLPGTIGEVEVLDFALHDVSRVDLLDEIYARSKSSQWSFIATVNVNHLVRLYREPGLLGSYGRAAIKVCDSRILAKLARLQGKRLRVNPGSDLVYDLLESGRFSDVRIAVVGPSRDEFFRLRAAYPSRKLTFVPSPNPVLEGSPEWFDLLERIEALAPSITLVGLSFPRQELLCDALGRRGKAGGVGIPCGAAVDFLTGKQRRAPLIVQRMSLEWLYRMCREPKRLVPRYLLDAIGFSEILWRGSILRRH